MDEKTAMYGLMCAQVRSLMEACPLPLPVLANCAALLWESMPDINWAGFYLRKGEMLFVGPFQGKSACMMIPMGRGVCGTAAQTRQLQLVEDVHQFPGHIACDSASNAEIVLPLIKNGELYGVMDIDSPFLRRFDQADAEGLTALCDILMAGLDWKGGLLG